MMEKNRENEMDLEHISWCSDVNSSEIPILHPKILEIDFYRGGAKFNHQHSADRQITFDQLLSLGNRRRFQCLVGPPGVGKTTLSKRLAKNQTYKLSIHLKVSEINYSDKLTLQELLLNKKFTKFGISPEIFQKAFSWILKNPSKCFWCSTGLTRLSLT